LFYINTMKMILQKINATFIILFLYYRNFFISCSGKTKKL